MGESSVTFKDGTVYNLEENFPSDVRRVALSMSGGVESTLLACILTERYGKDNVLVFSGQYEGRRWWESSHPAFICKQLGIDQHIPVPQTNHHMSPSDNWAMFQEQGSCTNSTCGSTEQTQSYSLVVMLQTMTQLNVLRNRDTAFLLSG